MLNTIYCLQESWNTVVCKIILWFWFRMQKPSYTWRWSNTFYDTYINVKSARDWMEETLTNWNKWGKTRVGLFNQAVFLVVFLNMLLYRGGSSHKDSNTVGSLITLKRTCQLLIYTSSQWYNCMSRISRSALAL